MTTIAQLQRLSVVYCEITRWVLLWFASHIWVVRTQAGTGKLFSTWFEENAKMMTSLPSTVIHLPFYPCPWLSFCRVFAAEAYHERDIPNYQFTSHARSASADQGIDLFSYDLFVSIGLLFDFRTHRINIFSWPMAEELPFEMPKVPELC